MLVFVIMKHWFCCQLFRNRSPFAVHRVVRTLIIKGGQFVNFSVFMIDKTTTGFM